MQICYDKQKFIKSLSRTNQLRIKVQSHLRQKDDEQNFDIFFSTIEACTETKNVTFIYLQKNIYAVI